jgi:hypothetical protein
MSHKINSDPEMKVNLELIQGMYRAIADLQKGLSSRFAASRPRSTNTWASKKRLPGRKRTRPKRARLIWRRLMNGDGNYPGHCATM